MARTNSQASTARYEAKVYDKTLIRLRKGELDAVRIHAASQGESLNGFLNRAIRETVERDTIKHAASAAGMSIEDYTRAAAIDALKRSQENQAKNPE